MSKKSKIYQLKMSDPFNSIFGFLKSTFIFIIILPLKIFRFQFLIREKNTRSASARGLRTMTKFNRVFL